MKILRALLLLVAVFATTISSKAINFSIFIENAATIKMTVHGNPVSLHDGLNNFNFAEYTTIELQGVNPYIISEIVDEQDMKWAILSSSWSKSLYTTDEGKTFYIAVRNLDETRTQPFTIKVDDPEKVNVVMEGSYLEVPLQAGENHLSYDPVLETGIIVTSPIYEYIIYKVTVNGIENPGYFGNFFIPLSSDALIDIEANYPDIDCNITFQYSTGEPGFLYYVTVDGQDIDFNGTSLTCKAGSQLLIYASDRYKFNSIKINGNATEWDTGMPLRVPTRGDTEVYIDAKPYRMLDVYVQCTDPQHIELFQGYTINFDRIELNSTESVIQIREDDPLLTWRLAPGCKMEALFIDGEEVDPAKDWVGVQDGTSIQFVTSANNPDIEFVVWVDDLSILRFFNFENANRLHFDTQIKNGYNILSTYSSGNPMTLAWFGEDVVSGIVYNGDEMLYPKYQGTPNYELTLKDKDVVRIFLTTYPEISEVKFDIEEGLITRVTKDFIVPIRNTDTDITVFKGAPISISAIDDIKVSVNGTELTANEDGNFTFDATEDFSTVVVEKAPDSGITAVGEDIRKAAIYNLQGMPVGVAAEDLPAGVYIRDGHKFVIK